MKIDILKSQKIRFVGTVEFPELYKYMKLWLEDNGFIKDQRNFEKKYTEKMKADGKKQLEIAWESQKSVSEFFEYHIDVTILALAMGDVEIQQEGIKKKVQKGDFEIRVSSYLKSTSRWDNLKGIQKLYHEMFIRKRIDLYLEELYKKSTSFQSFIKDFLGLRN